MLGTLYNAFCDYNDSKPNDMYKDIEREKRAIELDIFGCWVCEQKLGIAYDNIS